MNRVVLATVALVALGLIAWVLLEARAAPQSGLFDPQCGVWCPEGTRCQLVNPADGGARDVYECR